MLIAFAPAHLLTRNRDRLLLNASGYRVEYWAERNCGANRHANGSHIWPDLAQPLSTSDLYAPETKEFQRELMWRLADYIS